MKINNSTTAEVLMQALPYIKKYQGQILVVKYSSSAIVSDELKKSAMADLVLLNQIGIKVVLVHGGGSDLPDTLKKLNMPAEVVDGMIKADKETVEVVQMVLAGKVNKELVSTLENVGGKAIGISGVDGTMLSTEITNPEQGYVGEITTVNATPILDLLEKGYISVIAPLGKDAEGNILSVNADMAAARIAGELKACSLISMTDVAGVLANPSDESTLLSAINVSEAPYLIKQGVIGGRMEQRVNCCIEAIRRGVKRVFIVDGRVPHSILIEVFSDDGAGTMFFI